MDTEGTPTHGSYVEIDKTNSTFMQGNVVQTECELYGDTLFVFLVSGLGTTFVCLLGICGNILSAIVLSRPSMKSSVNILLFALSIFDLLFVTISLIYYGISGILQYFCVFMVFNNYFVPLTAPWLFPFIYVAQLGSVYMTVCVTVERFIVVYLPLKSRSWCTTRRATWASIVVTAFCIVWNIPTWWEYHYQNKYLNGTETLVGYTLELTDFRKRDDYVLYYITWGSFFVYRLVPFSILVVLNVIIYVKIRQANSIRKQLSVSQVDEISITKILLLIITTFLTCNLLALILNFRESFAKIPSSDELIVLSALFVTINSATNFLIYCVFGKKFRKVCVELSCVQMLLRLHSETFRACCMGVRGKKDTCKCTSEAASAQAHHPVLSASTSTSSTITTTPMAKENNQECICLCTIDDQQSNPTLIQTSCVNRN